MSWKSIELAKVCEVFADGDWIESKDQSDIGIRLIQTGNVGFGRFKARDSKARYINEETFKRLRCTEIKEGDLLVSRLPDPVGRACIIPQLVDKSITAVDCTIIRTKQEFLYSNYLNYYCQSPQYFEQVKKNITGATRQRISRSLLGKTLIPLAPLATQQKIVAKLDAIFAEIDTATAAAEANVNNAEALFQSYLNEVFERGGEGWETKKLCEVSSFDKNQGLHNGIPYIGMENIQSHTTQLISGVELVEEVKSSTFKFNETHLLYGRLRPYLNKVYAPDFVGHFSTEIFPIKPFSNLLRAYLKYWFINVKTVDRINATCTGARMPRANMNAVMDFDFPLPPISIQKQLIEYFDRVQNSTHIAIDSYKAKIAEITALKQSILQKAFSGELVKD